MIAKVTNLMKQLRTLKNASNSRRHGLLMAVIPNATRWGSLLACLLCYDAHYADLRNCDLDDDVLDTIPTAVEHRRIQELLVHLKQFETMSIQLMKGGSAQLDLSDVRCLFDKLLNKYPMLVRHLGDAGAIVANAEFERGIVKLQMGHTG